MNVKFRVWNGFKFLEQTGFKYLIGQDGQLMTWTEDYSLQESNLEYQFWTGLVDKAGKEIYEGDIIEHGYQNYNGAFKHRHFVYYSVDKAMFYLAFPGREQFNEGGITKNTIKKDTFYEVIGNIFQNKDLLK